MNEPQCPTMLTVARDLQTMTREEAIAKAVCELTEWIDYQGLQKCYAEVFREKTKDGAID
jgi:hypothetical protein